MTVPKRLADTIHVLSHLHTQASCSNSYSSLTFANAFVTLLLVEIIFFTDDFIPVVATQVEFKIFDWFNAT